MRTVRWVFVVPAALLLGMLGSLAGGFAAILFGQTAMNTASAFFGPFAFVFAATVIAPSRRHGVALTTASVVTLVAVGEFLLSMFATEEALSGFSSTQLILTPPAQFLGALCALTIAFRWEWQHE